MLNIVNLLIDTIGGLIVGLFVARFIFQLFRVYQRDPIVQAVAQFTNPIVLPLRKFVPGLMGTDLASLVAAVGVSLLITEILALLIIGSFINPLSALIAVLLGILNMLLTAVFIVFIIIAIASFIAPQSNSPALYLLRQLAEPILSPIRRILPPLGGLDLSMIPALILVQILKYFVLSSFSKLGISPLLVVGV